MAEKDMIEKNKSAESTESQIFYTQSKVLTKPSQQGWLYETQSSSIILHSIYYCLRNTQVTSHFCDREVRISRTCHNIERDNCTSSHARSVTLKFIWDHAFLTTFEIFLSTTSLSIARLWNNNNNNKHVRISTRVLNGIFRNSFWRTMK